MLKLSKNLIKEPIKFSKNVYLVAYAILFVLFCFIGYNNLFSYQEFILFHRKLASQKNWYAIASSYDGKIKAAIEKGMFNGKVPYKYAPIHITYIFYFFYYTNNKEDTCTLLLTEE
jgi:hypothetical protein